MSGISSYSQEVQNRIHLLEQKCETNQVLGHTPAFYEKSASIGIGAISTCSGAGALIGAAYGFTAFAITAPVAVVLIAAGSYLFYVSTQIYDYNDPVQLKKCREDAGKIAEDIHFVLDNQIFDGIDELEQIGTSLIDALVDVHGWNSLFYYGIPLPEDFEKLYKLQLEFLDINTWLKFHQRAEKAYQKAREKYGDNIFQYPILDHANWSNDFKHQLNQKWKREIQRHQGESGGYNVQKIFNTYNFDLLQEYGIIEENESNLFLNLHRDYQGNKERLKREGGTYYKAYKSAISPHKILQEREIWKAEKEFSSNNAHGQLEEITRIILSEVGDIRKERDRAIEPVLRQFKEFENGLTNCGQVPIQSLPQNLQDNLLREKNRADQQIREIRARFEGPLQEVKRKYVNLKRQFVDQLKNAREKRERHIQWAKRRYQTSKAEIQPRFRNILHTQYDSYHWKNGQIRQALSNFFI